MLKDHPQPFQCSLAVVTRLWRTSRRMEAIVVEYTTTTPIVSLWFSIPEARLVFCHDNSGNLRHQREIVWDYVLFKVRQLPSSPGRLFLPLSGYNPLYLIFISHIQPSSGSYKSTD